MSYDSIVLADASLLHYYELSGNLPTDSKGSVDGSIVGAASPSQPGFVDNNDCFLFDGVSGQITFAANWIPAGVGDWGMDFWFYPLSLVPSTIIQVTTDVDYRLDNGAGGFGIYLQTPSGKYFAGNITDSRWYYGTAGLTTSTNVCLDVYYPQHGGGTGGTAGISGAGIIGNGTKGFFHGYIQKVATYNNANSCSRHQGSIIGCPNVACAGGSLSVVVTPNPGDTSTILYRTLDIAGNPITWIGVSGPSSGPGTATFTIASNAGGTTRQGFVYIGNNQVFSVQQLGGC